MKRFFSLLAFLSVVAFAANAQEMQFENTTIDYGKITKGANGERVFKFTNTGTEPVIITNAQGSCGCTVPTKPEEPTMPGETGEIKVKYDTNRPGPFTKNVTLTSNDKKNPTLILTIKGEVEVPVEQPSVPASTDGIKN